MNRCPEHGVSAGEICLPCFGRESERIERESAPLRAANTAPALRDRVRHEVFGSNGNGHRHIGASLIEGAIRG